MKTHLLLALGIFHLNLCYGQQVSTFHNNPNQKIDDAMALDKSGNLYGSHYNGKDVFKITPDGNVSVFATGFNTPNGLALNSNQELYVCDMVGNRIYRLAPDGTFLDTITVTGPSGIMKAYDSDTMIFTQYTTHKVNKLAPNGTVIPYLAGSPLKGPVGLAYDENNSLYIANFTDRKIHKVSSGNLLYVATVPGPVNGWLGFITFARGAIWGTGYNDHKIYKILPQYTDSVQLLTGSVSGSQDGSIDVATFKSPNGIIPSITGDSLLISEYGTGFIRIIDFSQTGAVITPYDGTGKLKIFPNPSLDQVTIELDEKIEKILVYDLQGKLILETGTAQISLKTCESGTYLIQVISVNGIRTSKLIKE